MSQLLHPVTYTQKAGKSPLITEVLVASDEACLVSTTRSAVWVNPVEGGVPSMGYRVRCAFSEMSHEEVDAKVASELVQYSKLFKWENGFPLSDEGLSEALEHLRDYGVTKVDIVGSASALGKLAQGQEARRIVTDIFGDVVALVPSNRIVLGAILVCGSWAGFVVHNAPRSFAYLTD
jgi:hypothetical protein